MSEQRDIELTAAPENTIDSSGRRVIAVIGIDRYQGWRRLTNAVRDARGAAALFGQLGFESVTEPLFDDRATGKAIHELVTDDLRTLCADDSLVLFYAGHGGTRTHPLGSQVVKTGYLIPVDASDRAATWIELDGWLRAVSLLPAMHILVILDACHSGIALGPIIKWRDGGTWQTTPLSTLKARRSRRIITSALDDQVALDSGPVYGHSLFTGCLIEGLTHGFGSAGNRLTTGSELGLYLQRRVETHPNSRQTPDFGTFDFDDRGEMVIPFVIEQPSEPPELVGVEGDRLGHPNGVTVDEGTELLAEIGPAKPRLIVAVAVVVALLVVGVIAFRPLSQSAPAGCPTPSLDPNAVWSDEKRQRLASRRDAEARMLDVDFAAWQAARTRMCSAGVVAQSLRHACLDAVLVRFDVIARAVEGLASDVPTTDLGAFAIDPVVCEAARPPRLAPAATPLLREVVATALREAAVEAPYRRDEATELVHRVADEPCAAALARLLLAEATPLASERLRELSEAEQDAGEILTEVSFARVAEQLHGIRAYCSHRYPWLEGSST